MVGFTPKREGWEMNIFERHARDNLAQALLERKKRLEKLLGRLPCFQVERTANPNNLGSLACARKSTFFTEYTNFWTKERKDALACLHEINHH